MVDVPRHHREPALAAELTLLNTIPLVRLDSGLLTARAQQGRTRDPSRQPYGEHMLRPVGPGTAAAYETEDWYATPSMAASLLQLDEAWRKRTGVRLRLASCRRTFATQDEMNARWQRWVDLGRPTGTGYNDRTMSQQWYASANASLHQCGMAVDFDIEPMVIDDAGLAEFWKVADGLGFLPMILNPNLGQAEAWHFEHRGPLQAVWSLFRMQEHPNAYALMARVGCVLAGTYRGTRNLNVLYVQSRALLAGIDVGEPDGVLGTVSRTALLEAGLPGNSSPEAIIQAMNEKEVALDLFARF
jgi:hypothetical protein